MTQRDVRVKSGLWGRMVMEESSFYIGRSISLAAWQQDILAVNTLFSWASTLTKPQQQCCVHHVASRMTKEIYNPNQMRKQDVATEGMSALFKRLIQRQ